MWEIMGTFEACTKQDECLGLYTNRIFQIKTPKNKRMSDKELLSRAFNFISFAIGVYVVFGTDWYHKQVYFYEERSMILDVWLAYFIYMALKYSKELIIMITQK